MNFLRNPEIKRSIYFYISADILLTVIGFIAGIKYGILTFSLSMLFTLVHFIITYRRYRKIAALSLEIDSILHGKEDFHLNEYSEGELAILQSEIMKLTVQLREQADALQNEKIYLSDSIADISHQIKTPLTSINFILSFLSEPELSYERRQALIKELMTLISRIDWLISALLKISKLDAGTAKLKRETVSVSELIRLSTAPIAIPMELRSQRLEIHLTGDETFTGDLLWCAEALTNILKNCMEHIPSEGVIAIYALENAIFTEIKIEDSGCGIAKEDLPHLFERFYKGKNSSEQSVGIGLALARMIITSQNGTLKAENKADAGARFIIRFYKSVV